MYDYFTPKEGATGGVMIGLSAASLLLFNGKILGCSGLLNGTLLSPKKVLTDASEYWRLVFVTSFSLTTAFLLGPESVRDVRLLESNDPIPIPSALAYSLSGLLVGWGKCSSYSVCSRGVCLFIIFCY